MIDLMERKWLRFDNLQTLILDEADAMLQLGFDEDIEKIIQFIRNDKNQEPIQTILFSATFPDWVIKLAEKYLKDTYKKVDLLHGVKQKSPTGVRHLAIKCGY